MWEKQTAKLHEEGKYARESARNYGDLVRCVVIRFSLSSSIGDEFPPQELSLG